MRRSCGELVVLGDRGDGALAHHLVEVEVDVGLDRRAHQGDVDHAGAERAQLLGGGALAQLDLDAGAGAAKALHGGGHDRQQRRAHEGDPQDARLAGVDRAGGGDGHVELGEHGAGVAQEGLARRGQLHPAARALQQRAAELGLERVDLLAERRLGDVQSRRGAPEVQLLGDGDEIAKLAEFHDLDPMAVTVVSLIREPNQ